MVVAMSGPRLLVANSSMMLMGASIVNVLWPTSTADYGACVLDGEVDNAEVVVQEVGLPQPCMSSASWSASRRRCRQLCGCGWSCCTWGLRCIVCIVSGRACLPGLACASS